MGSTSSWRHGNSGGASQDSSVSVGPAGKREHFFLAPREQRWRHLPVSALYVRWITSSQGFGNTGGATQDSGVGPVREAEHFFIGLLEHRWRHLGFQCQCRLCNEGELLPGATGTQVATPRIPMPVTVQAPQVKRGQKAPIPGTSMGNS